MSASDPPAFSSNASLLIDYVKVRPFFNSAIVIRGKDDVRTAKVPDVVVSISDAARAAFDGMSAQQASEVDRYRRVDQASDAKAADAAPSRPDPGPPAAQSD